MRPRSVSGALSGAPSTPVLTPFVVRSVLRTSLTPHYVRRADVRLVWFVSEPSAAAQLG